LRHFVLWSFLLLILSSCGDEESNVSFNFKLAYDGEPLVMTEDYTYPDGKVIRFNRFSFFMSDVQLSNSDKSVLATDAEFINLTRSHLTAADARQGLTYDLGKHPISSITNVNFNIGLTQEQNTTVPADYESGSSLARPGEYWLAWDSYIFFKIEGFVDLDGDNDPETSIALHVGADDARRAISLNNSDGDENISMVIDVKDIFENGSVYDIANNPQIHSLSQLPLATILADNFRSTIKEK